MSVRDDRRIDALDRIADHMLAHGIGPSSLRALAAAAGTSDRMLLYYFTDKDDITRSALGLISLRIAAALEAAVPPGSRFAVQTALEVLAPVLRSPDFRPHMRVWFELVSLAMRGEQPFLGIAGQVADFFVDWVTDRLADGEEAARREMAAQLVATLDGLVLLDCVGRHAVADMALSRLTRTLGQDAGWPQPG